MSLEKWVKLPELRPRRASKPDILPLLGTFKRVRQVSHLPQQFTNVKIDWPRNPTNPDEWTLIVEVVERDGNFEVTPYPLRTTEKWKAVRRAFGWGLLDEDWTIHWPPEADEGGAAE